MRYDTSIYLLMHCKIYFGDTSGEMFLFIFFFQMLYDIGIALPLHNMQLISILDIRCQLGYFLLFSVK